MVRDAFPNAEHADDADHGDDGEGGHDDHYEGGQASNWKWISIFRAALIMMMIF